MPTELHRNHSKLVIGAIGVVFGDIGTSPLYAFRESFIGHHPLPIDRFHVLGVLSMLIWALVLVVTVKYVFATMRADNRGEGGKLRALALIERVAARSPLLPATAAAALMATALFYGDAVITPAISILSAVEGLSLLDDGFTTFVLPLTLALVVALFAVQRHGTTTIGGLFGPIMVIWFIAIGLLGAFQVAANPYVLAASDPRHALQFLMADPVRAFFTLGTVVLAVTGAEALYADMGHFGRTAIARAWLWLAFPALLLCYAGQAALVLEQSGDDPLAVLSHGAAGAAYPASPPGDRRYDHCQPVDHQRCVLGDCNKRCSSATCPASTSSTHPRKHEDKCSPPHTAMCLGVIALVLGFRSSAALAAAFGLAVTATMVLTTLMIGFVVFRIWRWNAALQFRSMRFCLYSTSACSRLRRLSSLMEAGSLSPSLLSLSSSSRPGSAVVDCYRNAWLQTPCRSICS